MSAHGGTVVGEVLARHGVTHLFTLCGGHISPILVGAKAEGIQIVDVRHEASAVFAADALARMTGGIGVAAVTAGPGVTNTLTAIKNAQMAQSPVLLFGGAAATVLKGRGSLQDIDQLSMLRPITKWATSVRTRPALGPTIEKAIALAKGGVPGPVFIEVPVDLLYSEETVREWYLTEGGVQNPRTLQAKALNLYLRGHLYRQFHQPHVELPLPKLPELRLPGRGDLDQLQQAVRMLRAAQRPALVIGSQTLVNSTEPERIAEAVEELGLPTWLGGSARGLLGRHSEIQFRHARKKSLKRADVVLVCGFPFDFRLSYGQAVGSQTRVIAVNLSAEDLKLNRRPELAVQGHPGEFLRALAQEFGQAPTERWAPWFEEIRARESERDAQIVAQGEAPAPEGLINPVEFFLRLEQHLADDAILAVDGGDFVATAAYILRPRAPLSWLDPGVFGTLGVGGGFAVGAAAAAPGREIWLIYGDGSSAYSLAEFDTFVRLGYAPIAVIGTDAAWAQIARDQGDLLGDDVGTILRRTDYHTVAEGYGGAGLLLDDPAKIDEVIAEAKALAAAGTPVCINVQIGRSDFRKGSISI